MPRVATSNWCKTRTGGWRLGMKTRKASIQRTLIALGDWCRGFMAAYALVLVEPEGAGLGEEVAEILKDIGAIADVGLSGEEDDEEAEGSYFEITEYLRFATLNLYLDNDSRGEAGD